MYYVHKDFWRRTTFWLVILIISSTNYALTLFSDFYIRQNIRLVIIVIDYWNSLLNLLELTIKSPRPLTLSFMIFCNVTFTTDFLWLHYVHSDLETRWLYPYPPLYWTHDSRSPRVETPPSEFTSTRKTPHTPHDEKLISVYSSEVEENTSFLVIT